MNPYPEAARAFARQVERREPGDRRLVTDRSALLDGRFRPAGPTVREILERRKGGDRRAEA